MGYKCNTFIQLLANIKLKIMNNKFSLLIILLLMISCTDTEKQEAKELSVIKNNNTPDPSLVLKDGESYSPYVNHDFPTNVYFGDTHLHTSISLDAFGDGNTKVGPNEAYRWAKGEVIAADDGMPTKISRPLDFLMVADHAEYMGIVPGLANKDESLMKNPEGARWAKMIEEGKLATHVFSEFIYDATGNKPRLVEPEFEMTVWNTIIDAAEKYNEPGKFTALIGYEWSAFPGGNNLHRVVVFKDGKEKTSQVRPFSAFDSENPEDLWKYLKGYETKTGGNVLAIPHNGNISGGRMFSLQDFNDNPITKEYAETRMRWEPLYEVTQYKGDGEAHPYLSPNDEFADFETWDKANLAMLEPHLDEYYETEYARSGLKLGLNQNTQLSVNPFKFGMIGSTDSHTGFPQVAEDNFLGKYGSASPNSNNKNRWKKEWPPVEGTVAKMYGWESQSAGYAAVWATENTREAIWDAMKRKEVYATTGPRMVVRMFGGFDFKEEDANNNNIAALGYSKGVPMGGDMTHAPENKSATFLVTAMKDPEGANLDRIQIIKGWIDNDENLQERVFDVAVSDGRMITNGKTNKKLISTVDVSKATYSNSIGDSYLSVTWTDPDFDANQKSFYYARIIEIPTPRWTAYDQVRFGIKMGPEVPMQIQERAYTSPIWYTPK
jgi:hypothetical protein